MKLLACVRMYINAHITDDRYAALSSIAAIRRDVLKKLLGMLLHPIPRVGLLYSINGR
jgi:hypothetical protein